MVNPLFVVSSSVIVPFKVNRAVSSIVVRPPPSISRAAELTRSALYRTVDTMIHVVARLTKESTEKSEHLKGVHAPQPDQVSVLQARVTGELPADLVGMFVNVNPNPLHLPLGGYHVFEGDGALTSVRIHNDGRASFAYTHFNTDKLRYEKEIGCSNELSVMAMRGYSGLLLVLLNELRSRLAKNKYSRSTANTNIEQHRGRLYALWESGLPHELGITADGIALQTLRQLEFDDYDGPFSAHPVAHPTNGNWYSVSYMLENPEQDAAIVVLDSKSQFVRAIPLHLGRKPIIHDAAITDKHVIILDLSVLFTPKDMLKPNGGLIRCHEDKPGRIGLFPVDGTDESEIIWFEVPSCASLHVMNAYDTEHGVVLHISQFSRFNFFSMYDISDPKMMRYELNLITGKVVTHAQEIGLEGKFGSRSYVDLPFVNPKSVGRNAKFGFGNVFIPSEDRSDIPNLGVCKFNLETGEPAGAIKFPGDGLGEAGFVEKKNAADEDEGYLMQFVKCNDGNTVMNVYDAVTMSETPIATVHAPEGFHVPSGFHSQFIDSHTLTGL